MQICDERFGIVLHAGARDSMRGSPKGNYNTIDSATRSHFEFIKSPNGDYNVGNDRSRKGPYIRPVI